MPGESLVKFGPRKELGAEMSWGMMVPIDGFTCGGESCSASFASFGRVSVALFLSS